MKPIIIDKKLVLNKITVADLNNDEKRRVRGGGTWEPTCTCPTERPTCQCTPACTDTCAATCVTCYTVCDTCQINCTQDMTCMC